MKNFAASLLALWQQLGLNQRVSLIVAVVAVIGGMIAVGLWARRPDYQLLYARLSDKDSAAIISTLQTQNIPYQLAAGGSTIHVPADRVHKLRMELAGKGLPGGEGVGFEIFDKGQFGLSDFVQRTNYLRAIQGELSRTIMQLQGVRAARVMIVQPENRLLLTDSGVKSTASVFVDMGGARLESDQVNAIRHLVANAVQGLAPDQVAVVDNRGRVLSEELRQDPTLGTASSQMRYKQQVEDYLARKVESMLAQVIGPGAAVVRVSAEIETEAMTQTQERYDPDGQVVRTQTITEDASNSTETRTTGGAAGVSANVPEKTAGDAPARPVSSTEQRRTPEELNALRQVVVNALGLKLAPGQDLSAIVALQEMPFAGEQVSQTVAAIQNETRLQGWIEVASRWAAVAGAAIALLLFLRLLSKQKPEPVPLEVFSMPPEMAARTLQSGSAVTPEMLNQLIRQKPANIGSALRDWVATPPAKN